MTPQLVETAAVVLIGNELLSGSVRDDNLVELARTLRALGIQLKRGYIVPDTIDAISEAVRSASAQHDVVFTSGGVGPTHDDITVDGVAAAFDVPVVVSAELCDTFRALGDGNLTDGHLRMARMPSSACLLTLPHLLWPTIVMHNVWILPGVPTIFRSKLEMVREYLRGPRPFFHASVCCRSDELVLKHAIDRIVSEYCDVQIGSYPQWPAGEFSTKLTFDATSEERVVLAYHAFLELLPEGEIIKRTEAAAAREGDSGAS